MTRLEKEKVLENIYYDVEEGFGSVKDLYEKARKVDVGITLDMVSAWMRAQPNKQTRNYKNYNSYTACTVPEVWIPNWLDGCHQFAARRRFWNQKSIKIWFNMHRYFQ